MTGTPKQEIPVLIYRYQGPRRNIGYTLSPFYVKEQLEVSKDDMLFIYAEDFEYIQPFVEKHFPLIDAFTGESMDKFDPCWDNPLMKEAWLVILEDLEKYPFEELELGSFIEKFMTWVRKHVHQADGIEVSGNL
ncbi:hypothetical protein [Paenibacillus tundrae]|uniref:Uncharacterized protein n=1 Tax=Paenibacillus tundrae TaxID=528187 RepID=A0ABT9WD82_9BACL|nr:hypothetical protein [Paenibacillus tundrae]MDQ0171201.1 hypothetical protein [Paenibacillus tundrae]